MEAWNVYFAIRVDHVPSCTPSLIAYQRIITLASVSYPLQSWLNYDVQFRMLAASDPSLRWDTRHPDLWLQCITPSGIQQSKRWLCPYCIATNHFPDRCAFCTNPSKQLSIVDNGITLRDNTIQESAEAQLLTDTICQGTQDPDIAETSTIHHVHERDASLPIIANTAVPITQHGIAHM